MFDFQQPFQHREKPSWVHVFTAGFGLTAALFVAAFARGPVTGLSALWRHFLLEWAPAILVVVATRFRASTPGTAVALALAFGGAIAGELARTPVLAVVGALAALAVLLSVQVANQWEKGVVLRFGRYHALRGPGMFRIVPIIDRVA